MTIGRLPRALLAVMLLVLSLAGCRSSYDETNSAASPGADGFPVTIKHTFGKTTVPSKPERIVTLGYSAQDVVFALGLTPVGMPRSTYGANDDGVMPWDAKYYDPDETTLLDESDGEPYEAIADLNPDVILAPYHGFSKGEYQKLSAIAPTVAYPHGPFQTPWKETTQIVGKALGMSDEATALIKKTDDYLDQAEKDNPDLAGKTLSVTYMGSKAIDVYMPTVAMVAMLEDMGMVSSPGVQKLADEDGGKNFSVTISWENVADIDADVVIAFIDDLTADQIRHDKPTSGMQSFKNDSVVYMADQSVVAAFVFPSVLSIPMAMDSLLPQASEAAENSAG